LAGGDVVDVANAVGGVGVAAALAAAVATAVVVTRLVQRRAGGDNPSVDGTGGGAGGGAPPPSPCTVCDDRRVVDCPSCGGLGSYISNGRGYPCSSCRAKGRVLCRVCYTGDPYDVVGIRRIVDEATAGEGEERWR